MSEAGISRMFPAGLWPKLAAYVCCAYLSQSEEKTHSAPADSKANRIPPIPQNKSINLGRFTLSCCTCEPKITQIGPNVGTLFLEFSARHITLAGACHFGLRRCITLYLWVPLPLSPSFGDRVGTIFTRSASPNL